MDYYWITQTFLLNALELLMDYWIAFDMFVKLII